jgi:hypothetical protein
VEVRDLEGILHDHPAGPENEEVDGGVVGLV